MTQSSPSRPSNCRYEHLHSDHCSYRVDLVVSFTRSRSYKQKDQACVEQKNSSIVCLFVGDDGSESGQAHQGLVGFYEVLHPYTNYFVPSLKLIAKQRVDAKVRKTYNTATPSTAVYVPVTFSPMKTSRGQLKPDSPAQR